MASLYDYGIPEATNNMINLYNVMSQDRERKAMENQYNIANQAAMFKLKKDMEQEQMLNKNLNIRGWLSSQGVHPEDQDVIINGWKGLGVINGDQGMESMQIRNLPLAMQHFQEEPKFRLAIAQSRYGRMNNLNQQYQDEINKIIEKDPINYAGDKKYQELVQKKNDVMAQLRNAQKQIEGTQMLLDPKLRETMEERALARQQKADETKIRQEETEKHNRAMEEIARDRIEAAKDRTALVASNKETKEDVRRMRRENDFNKILTNVQRDIEKLDQRAISEAMPTEEYNRQIRGIKAMYGKQLDQFRKDGLWHGWDESNNKQQTNSIPKPSKSKSGKDIWQWPDGKWYYEPPRSK